MKQDKDSNTVNLFWSGGWDSTFRLLQLVVEQGKLVQPYYVIDPNRLSLRHELKAMSSIKKLIYQRYPNTRGLILPTITTEVDDIVIDEEFEQAYREFLKIKKLDTQYRWMGHFCRQHDIHEVELSVERKANPKPGQRPTYFLEKVGEGPEYRIADQYREGIEYIMNGRYSFPIYGMTKMDAKEYSDKADWSDIMALTWFCHYPIRGRYPCGTCLPCDLVLREGLGWRIPWWRRVYAKLGLETLRKKASEFVHKTYPQFHRWQK